MPSWIMRLVWKVRGKRLVRIHLEGDKPTMEGILVGCWGGHYVLLRASIYEAAERSISLTGHIEVPRESVLFVQVLTP